MAGQYRQVDRLKEKAARLREKARQAGNPKMAARYLQQAENVLASVQAIKDNWKEFGKRARGNTNRRGTRHSPEAREKMSRARRLFWKSKAGFEKMWRARRARQFREEGKCLLRFPRLSASTAGNELLKDYRKRYERITGQHLGRSDIILYHEDN